MQSIAVGEAVTASNPRLFFAYQLDGRLQNFITSLKRSVYEIPVSGAPVIKVTEASLNLADAPVGVRLSDYVGVYHANFTATSFTPGTHEIRWKYIVSGSTNEVEIRQRFEVLDTTNFVNGMGYVGYADSAELRRISEFSAKTAGEMQVLIDRASRRIELLTGRYFEPRICRIRHDGRGIRSQPLQYPIIGVAKVELETGITGVVITTSELGLDGLRFYARHLTGLIDPDDRDDPRIEIARFEGIIYLSLALFPKAPQGVIVTGVFGYTDPDGGPMGKTPQPLSRVVGALALREMTDPLGLDPLISTPGRIATAKTRDQSIGYRTAAGGGLGNAGSYAGLTGDPFIDEMLLPYVRPIHMGSP